jgi:outer membrane protein OmpA-like peptidoglycan-associated protein
LSKHYIEKHLTNFHMKIPLWLLALLFAGYTAWCVNYWHCNVCQCCDGTGAVTTVAETTGEPRFNWNAAQPVSDAKFPDWKNALLAKGGQGDTLVITGYYRADEADGERLARARAEAIRAMLAPQIPESRVKIATKMVDDGLTASNGPKASADFAWLKMVLTTEDSAVIESGEEAILLFPFNSSVRESDPKVDAYLKSLCEKHKATNANFTVVGHTDDVGTDQENFSLGLARAKSVAQTMIANGIAAARIKTDSKGEKEPVAGNDTDEGRHQNRRVVITVNR